MMQLHDSGAYLLVLERPEAASEATREAISLFCNKLCGQPVDLVVVAPEGDAFGIDRVRAALACASLSVSPGKKKVIVLERAETLTLEAQNCLLKRLEEPPDGTVFLLITANANALIPTVRSRCQVLELPGVIEPDAESSASAGDLKWALQILGEGEPKALASVSRMGTEEALRFTEALIHLFRRIVIDLDSADARLKAAAVEALWLVLHAYSDLKQNASPGLCLEALVARLFQEIPGLQGLEGLVCLS